MSHEFPKNNNEKSKGGIEDLYARFTSEIERAERVCDRTAMSIAENRVPKEFRAKLPALFESIKDEIKPPLLLRAEVLTTEYVALFAEVTEEFEAEFQRKLQEINEPAEKAIDVLIEELNSGISVIMAGEGDNARKLELVDTLQESVEERRSKVLSDLEESLKRVIDDHLEEKEKRLGLINTEALVGVNDLFVEFVDKYFKRVDVILGEISSK